jgi:pentatricopeptide repeat domain-containing protein 1
MLRGFLSVPLLEQMAARSVVANAVTYNILIAACERGGQWQKSAQLFERMKASSIEPDTISYVALMGALLRGGQLRSAIDIFRAMMAAGKWRMLLRVLAERKDS